MIYYSYMEKIFLVLHGISLVFVITMLALSYASGISWMKGRSTLLNAKKIATYHHSLWLGIVLMITTGFGAFWSHHTEFLAKWQFHTKMSFLLVLIINCVVINRLIKVGTTREWNSLSKKEKLPIIITTTASTICWTGIIIMAMFIGIDE